MKYSVGNYFADTKEFGKFRYFKDLYDDYVKYCNKKSYPVVGSDEFIDNIKEYGVVGEVIQGELVLVYLAEYNRGLVNNNRIDKNVNQPNHYMIGDTDVLTIINDVRTPRFTYEFLRELVRDLKCLSLNYGYKHKDILDCYWIKWNKNINRINSEWN